MLELIEILAKEWTVIKQAPRDFAGALLLCLAAVGTVQWHILKVINRKRSENEPQKHPELKPTSSLPLPRAVARPEKKPVFRLSDIEQASIHCTGGGVWETSYQQYGRNFPAVLLPITYDAKHSETTYTLQEFAAHVCLTEVATGKRIDIESARWIGGWRTPRMEFPLGATRKLVLAISTGTECQIVDVYERTIKIAEGTYEVSIILTWDGGKFVIPDFKFPVQV